MAKKIILFLFVFAQMQGFYVLGTMNKPEDLNKPSFWLTNYDEAVSRAKSTGKPILLFFTGSDWCSWCHKLEEESLDTPEFIQTTGDAFVFLKLDFPLYSQQNANIKTQNKQLQKKFDVRSYPTIIILDPQQNQQIGITGYRPGGGKQYANHLLKMLHDYSGYKQKMSALDKQKHSGRDLKTLYEKAKDLKIDNDAQKIVQAGMDSDQNLFFLIEQYRHMVKEGQICHEQAAALRQQLLDIDPKNENQTHYQIAVIDFEAYSDDLEKEDHSPEIAVAPLVEYIKKFADTDKENLWRLQMIISQVYLDKNQISNALNYAQSSYNCAPQNVRVEISKAIENIQSMLHSTAAR